MFMLRSTHDQLIRSEQEHCAALLARCEAQISDLRRLVFVQEPTAAQEHPIRMANAILDGREVMPTVDPKQEADDLAEANRILSGSYDRIEDTW